MIMKFILGKDEISQAELLCQWHPVIVLLSPNSVNSLEQPRARQTAWLGP